MTITTIKPKNIVHLNSPAYAGRPTYAGGPRSENIGKLATKLEEQLFMENEKYRTYGNDCTKRVIHGQCILKRGHTGIHKISHNKTIVRVLTSNNILVKVMRSDWR